MLHTATAFGLQLCFIPVRSPESNGIAEAFAKTRLCSIVDLAGCRDRHRAAAERVHTTHAVKHRPRIRPSIWQRTRVPQQWPYWKPLTPLK
jgi:hypothetical protein